MESKDQERLGELVDEGLAKYVAEPRAGLEGRVLARLREEPAPPPLWGRLKWPVFAMASAILVVAVSMVLRHPGVTTPKKSAEGAAASTSLGNQTTAPTTRTPERPVETDRAASHRRPSFARLQSAQTQVIPKLEQFPAPRPLSEQEKLMLAYLAQTPREELIATAAHAKNLSNLLVKDLEIPALQIK